METYSSDDIKRRKRKNEKWKIPLEERLDRTIDRLENMFRFLLHSADIIDSKLNSIQEKIFSLETRNNMLEQELTKNQINSNAPPPTPAPRIKKEPSVNPRKELMNELHNLLEKRNQNFDENQKRKNRNNLSIPTKKSLSLNDIHGGILSGMYNET